MNEDEEFWDKPGMASSWGDLLKKYWLGFVLGMLFWIFIIRVVVRMF